MAEKRKISLSILFVIVLGALIAFMVLHRRDFKLPELSLRSSPRAPDSRVVCAIVTKIGDKHLRMGFIVHVEDRAHQETLLQKLPMIKHDLLVSANNPEWALLYEIRDFDRIRDRLLTIINDYSDKPVRDIYFESFYYD
ncbi:MAG: flagellar basal body-associated FliL family protein [Deltaproteobacteria bacterium]|nr:flagellar basal body-associated FliL family protein [Deltaproteobacteria bacterium]